MPSLDKQSWNLSAWTQQFILLCSVEHKEHVLFLYRYCNILDSVWQQQLLLKPKSLFLCNWKLTEHGAFWLKGIHLIFDITMRACNCHKEIPQKACLFDKRPVLFTTLFLSQLYSLPRSMSTVRFSSQQPEADVFESLFCNSK